VQESKLELEIKSLKACSHSSEDPYMLALVANTYVRESGERERGRERDIRRRKRRREEREKIVGARKQTRT
jgi:hypothetical protein